MSGFSVGHQSLDRSLRPNRTESKAWDEEACATTIRPWSSLAFGRARWFSRRNREQRQTWWDSGRVHARARKPGAASSRFVLVWHPRRRDALYPARIGLRAGDAHQDRQRRYGRRQMERPRIGAMRGLIQGKQEYGAVAFGMKAVLATPAPPKNAERLSPPPRGNRQVLPDRRASRPAGGDVGDRRGHGGRRAEQTAGRRTGCAGRGHTRQIDHALPRHRPLERDATADDRQIRPKRAQPVIAARQRCPAGGS